MSFSVDSSHLGSLFMTMIMDEGEDSKGKKRKDRSLVGFKYV